MPVGIVDLLEVVQVDEDERQTRSMTRDQLDLAIQRLMEVAKIEE